MKTVQFLIFVAVVVLFAGCAVAPPAELVNARASYNFVADGTANELVPAEVHKAKEALFAAEKSFANEANTYRTRDLAYVAMRKAELAGALGAMASDTAAKANADADFQKRQTELLKQGKKDLSASEQRGADTRTALAASELSGEQTAAKLEAEKQARMTAEARLAGAMKDLATIAAIKEDARGVVITLSGAVLFASNKFALLNTAMTKLDQVAEALKSQGSDKRMVVEGHTDSQGSDQINQPLSINRANSVRDYLVLKGVDSSKISAVGLGSSKPITDNKTAENRANNRRVEIIIERGTQTSNR